MQEHFKKFVYENANKVNNLLLAKLTKIDKDNKISKLYRSFQFLSYVTLTIAIVLAGLMILVSLNTSFFKGKIKTDVINWILLGFCLLFLFVSGLAASNSKKYKAMEIENGLKKLQINELYQELYKLVNLDFRFESDNVEIQWYDSISLNDNKKEYSFYHKALFNNDKNKNASWKIQQFDCFNNTDKKEQVLLLEGKLNDINISSSFMLGSQTGLNEVFFKMKNCNFYKNDEKFNIYSENENIKFKYIADIEKLFEDYKLGNNKFGLIIDKENQKIYEWIKIDNSLFNIKNTSDVVYMLLNHIYLIKLLQGFPFLLIKN
ncbi:hypothetical protein [Mycoplasmopsis lipofaciens]|uniref:hypothetical protein n=1 Tax=Mycoplasmopsis lipofaciens TaxID=114884 RepID=UPI0004884EBC|nr:hypothetical protein [Mycoplasmopsis lipofaciens]